MSGSTTSPTYEGSSEDEVVDYPVGPPQMRWVSRSDYDSMPGPGLGLYPEDRGEYVMERRMRNQDDYVQRPQQYGRYGPCEKHYKEGYRPRDRDARDVYEPGGMRNVYEETQRMEGDMRRSHRRIDHDQMQGFVNELHGLPQKLTTASDKTRMIQEAEARTEAAKQQLAAAEERGRQLEKQIAEAKGDSKGKYVSSKDDWGSYGKSGKGTFYGFNWPGQRR